MRIDDTKIFPRYGARARTWSRFERELRAWLDSPEGRFAAWRAARQIEAPPPPKGDRARR